MFRTQPPGFRWLVGGFALLAAVAFAVHYPSDHDKGELVLGAVCLAVAGYWLVLDRFISHDPPEEDED